MGVLERLLALADQLRVQVYEENMPERMKGLYGDNVIWLNKNIETDTEKVCVLAEEIGHHLATAGNIIDQNILENRRREKKARRWAYDKLVPLTALIEVYQKGIQGQHELAEFLGVTEEFLGQAIQYYKEKYGLYRKVGDYYICFEPLTVIEVFTEGSDYQAVKNF